MFRDSGLGIRVRSLGFGVEGWGFRALSLGPWASGLEGLLDSAVDGFGFWGLGFMRSKLLRAASCSFER